MLTRTLDAVAQPPAPIAHPPYDVLSPETAEKPTGVGDNSLISLDLGREDRFGFRSIQLGFPSAWAWISFSPSWNSFSPAWNSFRAGWEGRPRPPFGRGGSEATEPARRAGPGDRPAWELPKWPVGRRKAAKAVRAGACRAVRDRRVAAVVCPSRLRALGRSLRAPCG
jgi:hypothetical protein